MKETASFYNTKAWRDCRNAYAKSVGGLCENCFKKGIYKPGEIVHHKTFINQTNMYNPEITLNFNNLEYLCRDCHGAVHNPRKRYKVDEFGRVIFK